MTRLGAYKHDRKKAIAAEIRGPGALTRTKYLKVEVKIMRNTYAKDAGKRQGAFAAQACLATPRHAYKRNRVGPRCAGLVNSNSPTLATAKALSALGKKMRRF